MHRQIGPRGFRGDAQKSSSQARVVWQIIDSGTYSAFPYSKKPRFAAEVLFFLRAFAPLRELFFWPSAPHAISYHATTPFPQGDRTHGRTLAACVLRDRT